MRLSTVWSCTFIFLMAPLHASAQTSAMSIASLGDGGQLLTRGATLAGCSDGGAKIAFSSSSPDVVSGDTNGVADVFLRDTTTGSVTVISSFRGTPGNAASGDVGLGGRVGVTRDGRYIAYASVASTISSPLNTSGLSHIIVHDTLNNRNSLVSLTSSGAVTETGQQYEPSISDNGSKVAFVSTASDLVGDDSNGNIDVFIRDSIAGSTTRVSVDGSGMERASPSNAPRISGDGSVVLFGTFGGFAPDDVTSTYDFYVKTISTGAIERVGNTANGEQPAQSSQRAALSRDGRYVAFSSYSSDHVVKDDNSTIDVFLYDRTTKVTKLVSTNALGGLTNDGASGVNVVDISPDGRYVFFDSTSNQLTAADTISGVFNLFVKDTVTGAVSIVDQNPGGSQLASGATLGALCGVGPVTALIEASDGLVQGDTNGANDFILASLSNPVIPPLEKGTNLRLPPAVSVADNTATVTLAAFNGVTLGKGKRAFRLPDGSLEYVEVSRAVKVKVNYVVTVASLGGARRDSRVKNSTRNIITFRNLPPAVYKVSYRVQAVSKGKVLFQTKPSPASNFTIP